jgi:hypothetical protein
VAATQLPRANLFMKSAPTYSPWGHPQQTQQIAGGHAPDAIAGHGGVRHRRPVTRPDLKEVDDLLDYETPARKIEILEPFVKEMARELGVESAELAALA